MEPSETSTLDVVRMHEAQRMASRRHSRRRVVATVLVGVSLAACGASTPPAQTAFVETARADVLQIRAAARRWIDAHVTEPLEVAGEHPSADYCPTIAALKKAQLVAPGVAEKDPWGRRYRIECGLGLYVVVSKGPDGVLGTQDDVRSDR